MEDCPSPVLLLVEDEALIALDTQKQLEKHGYQVSLAYTAASAIQNVETNPCISMVLMDIDLGTGMDGTEAARKILQLRELPVIFMSSHSEAEIIERTETVSAYGYIVKGSAMPAILASLHMAQKLFSAQELAKEHTLRAVASEQQIRTTQDGLADMPIDIQDRKWMERQIHEEHARAQLYLDMAGVFFLALDREGCITMINRRGCAILGLPLHKVLGHSWFELYLDPAEAGKVQQIFRQIVAGELNQVEFHENEIRTADGGSRTIAWHNNVIRDDSGKIVGTISAGEDITERRAAEAALRANEEKHRFLFENMTQGVVYHAPDDSILYANQAAADILGLSLDQLYGKTSLDPRWKAVHEDGTAYSGSMHPSQICLREKKAVHDAIMGIYNPVKENYSWIRINAIPKLTSAGELELVVVIFEDLSEIKQYENSLRQQVEEKNILIKETHHRIKNNIATISSLLSLQADANTDSNTVGSADGANAALKEAVSRIESMQALYESMLLRDDFETVSARDYLTDLSAAVLNLFANKRQIQLKTDLQDLQLPPKTMFLLGIICNELLTNVLKYAFPSDSGGQVLLSLRTSEDKLELRVEDKGKGLPDDFEDEGKSGFGLMLVNMLSQQLKGSFEISDAAGSQDAKGTVAAVRIPA